jgi:KUP system potassium uptake protein
MITAVGIVFGDIGTSPLYALQAIFGVSHIAFTGKDILGAVSLIIWAITLVVTVKYVGLVMRANNAGDGGIMALIALMKRTKVSARTKVILTFIGLIGVSLFYGDSVITPAISVLSAVGGINLVAPEYNYLIIPITIVILIGLFFVQSRGTESIGRVFGPVMAAWFLVSATGGFMQILHYPPILMALLPTTALGFFIAHPLPGFIAMGAVVLAITGVEALFADMGHFGTSNVRKAWLFFIFPALLFVYLGQGALVTLHPSAISSAYYLMFAPEARLAIIILATVATLIASQAVLSGAFSLTSQAVQLGFAPRITIRHTSTDEVGQVYVPVLNWSIAAFVVLTVILFENATNLAGAYGFAVCGALAVDTIFLIVIMRHAWRYNIVVVLATAAVFIGIDTLFISSSAQKLLHGAWLPVIIALISLTLLTTWYRGHSFLRRERRRIEGTLKSFVTKLHNSDVQRIDGTAVYIGHHPGNAPLALHESLEQLHELHENVVIVTVETSDKPHIPEKKRVVYDGLGHPDDGISHITLQFGYKDIPNVPRALALVRGQSSETDFDPYKSTYFTSVGQPVIVHNHRMAIWRKKLYLFMQRNASNPSDYYRLPIDRTVEMRGYLEL